MAVVSHITYLSEQTKLSLISHDVCIILTLKRFREIKKERARVHFSTAKR